ncbi:MAG: hypothetical protein KGN84_09740 [Acidobacteriota bacterium]|nr:hypothetical protein [Acidobacteriota bacterium]
MTNALNGLWGTLSACGGLSAWPCRRCPGPLFLLLTLPRLAAATGYTYWIEPCPPAAVKSQLCQTNDPELAKWALEAWQREAAGSLTLTPAPSEEHAQIRMRWADASTGLYGEAVPIAVDGHRGANVYIFAGPSRAADSDPLLRDTIVYLTCVHESGHALGLQHTAKFADIMYTFQYGGDLAAYFGRYRRLLKSRTDIPQHSGISGADRVALRSLYK